jgi:hypothetical protein
MAKLQEMEEEFLVMDFPSNLPDLNPIENCWAYMKAKLKMNTAIIFPAHVGGCDQVDVSAGPAPGVLPAPQMRHAYEACDCP